MGWSSVNISMSSQLIAFKNNKKKKKSCKAHGLDGEREVVDGALSLVHYSLPASLNLLSSPSSALRGK